MGELRQPITATFAHNKIRVEYNKWMGVNLGKNNAK